MSIKVVRIAVLNYELFLRGYNNSVIIFTLKSLSPKFLHQFLVSGLNVDYVMNPPSKYFLFSKTSWRRVCKTSFKDVFKTSSQDVFNTFSRGLQDVSARRLLQDISRTSCNYVLKTSWKTKKCYSGEVFKTSSRRPQYVSTKTKICWAITGNVLDTLM